MTDYQIGGILLIGIVLSALLIATPYPFLALIPMVGMVLGVVIGDYVVKRDVRKKKDD